MISSNSLQAFKSGTWRLISNYFRLPITKQHNARNDFICTTTTTWFYNTLSKINLQFLWHWDELQSMQFEIQIIAANSWMVFGVKYFKFQIQINYLKRGAVLGLAAVFHVRSPVNHRMELWLLYLLHYREPTHCHSLSCLNGCILQQNNSSCNIYMYKS